MRRIIQNPFQKTFSVDEFLQEHRNAAPLETMRDDLGIYLKVLRSAMIELINEDYADFVNLSSNLIGLDQSINGIQLPLVALKEEILSIKSTLEDTMNDVNQCLEQKRQLRDHLKSVHSLTSVRKSVEKLTNLLSEQLCDENALDAVLLERAAMELIKLKYDLRFCQHHIAKLENRGGMETYNELQKQLLGKVQSFFLKVLGTKNNEQLERCLRVYSTLGEQPTAEAIFRKEIIGPYMNSIISETALQNSPHGLDGIYKQVLRFFDDKMKQLLALTHFTGTHTTSSHVAGFDFIINSFWTEVELRLEINMSSIFAPGNPDAFYQKYKCSNSFLEKIEGIIKNEEKTQIFRAHKQYKQFQSKWNLPVYFQVCYIFFSMAFSLLISILTFISQQIRFQEIGGALETACNKAMNKDLIESSSDTSFQLKPFITGSTCISECWTDGIYLSQLFLKFFKFCLQIFARLAIWMDECISVKDWPSNEFQRIDFFVILYLDAVKLIKQMPNIKNVVTEKLPVDLNTEIPLFEKALNDSSMVLTQKLKKIEELWIKEMLAQTSGWTKQVADIPRLYRKTNRDAPSKACQYIDQILKPAQSFAMKYGTKIPADTVKNCLSQVFSQLNRQ